TSTVTDLCLRARASYSFFFFFLAEDGIRDRNVTGVQTCALPILLLHQLGRNHKLHHTLEPCLRLSHGQLMAYPLIPVRSTQRIYLQRFSHVILPLLLMLSLSQSFLQGIHL